MKTVDFMSEIIMDQQSLWDYFFLIEALKENFTSWWETLLLNAVVICGIYRVCTFKCKSPVVVHNGLRNSGQGTSVKCAAVCGST